MSVPTLADPAGRAAGGELVDAQERFARVRRGGMPRHGEAGPRADAALGGRYGYLFPRRTRPAPWLAEAVIDELADALFAVTPSTDNFAIPAGYTYFAQFVDHDLTFDTTSQLRRVNDADALVDLRTPTFDLDSLYGSGPKDQPYLYDWSGRGPGARLLTARHDGGELAAVDLPRSAQGRAIIGDPRNDENLIVSQLHLLFIRFHNRVVDELLERHRGPELFERARRIVLRHYQWVVINDLLPKLVGPEMAADALVARRHFKPRGRPFMPVEFSAAAFRFGHSMVREDYTINATGGVPILHPRTRGGERHLAGFRPLLQELAIDWRHFFPLARDVRPQFSRLIDPSLVGALSRLPAEHASLARLNLMRGQALGLRSGQDVARRMRETPLTPDELAGAFEGVALSAGARDALAAGAPLWLYCLCEARIRCEGAHLGPVGGRIVAEVLAGLLAADPGAYIHEHPAWEPTLPKAGASFALPDLVRFALGG